MISYPESLRDAVKEVASKYPTDIPKAIEKSMAAIQELPDYNEFVQLLIQSAVQELIYDLRHHHNVAIKRQAGQYGQPAKVIAGASESAGRAAHFAYLSYRIGSTVLGDVLGADLPGIADTEAAIASGHQFNAELCHRLAAMVPADKRVRDAVSEKKLKAVWHSVEKKLKGAA